jgi:hypothetical protein
MEETEPLSFNPLESLLVLWDVKESQIWLFLILELERMKARKSEGNPVISTNLT